MCKITTSRQFIRLYSRTPYREKVSSEDKKRKSKSRERSAASKDQIEKAERADSKDQSDGDNVKGRQRSKSREKKKQGKESAGDVKSAPLDLEPVSDVDAPPKEGSATKALNEAIGKAKKEAETKAGEAGSDNESATKARMVDQCRRM